MKKIVIYGSIISALVIAGSSVFATDAPKSFTEKTGYDLYKFQVENYCKEYKKTDKNNEIIMVLDEWKYFKDLWKQKPDTKFLENTIKDYKKNMDGIYGCATYSAYYRTLKTIKEEIIKRNPKLSSRLSWKLDQKMKEIQQKIKSLDWNCKLGSKKNNFVKKAVLNQTTYETCKYNFYLEYLKDYSKNISSIVDTNSQESIQIKALSDKMSSKLADIDAEIENTYRTFPIAYQAYNDYENNIWSHVYLELLKEDYKTFRLGLHKTLNPINQVVYKISNAMRR